MFSIINLVSLFCKFLGIENNKNIINIDKVNELLNKKHILHIIIDGMGYEFLKSKGGFFFDNTVGTMLSTFPSSTTAAMTSYYTGLNPGEHGLFGWNQKIENSNLIFNPLKITHQEVMNSNYTNGILQHLESLDPFWTGTKHTINVILPRIYNTSIFTNKVIKDSSSIFYEDQNDGLQKTLSLFAQNKKNGDNENKKSYTLAYIPYFDDLAHKFGVHSDEVDKYFILLQKDIKNLLHDIKLLDLDVGIIISSDHGQIHSKEKEIIILPQASPLYSFVEGPISGESRFIYFTPKTKDTIDSINAYLSILVGVNNFIVYETSDLIQNGWFGQVFKTSFYERLGSHVCVLNEGFQLVQSHQPKYIGNHGGISKEENIIPVIVFDSSSIDVENILL